MPCCGQRLRHVIIEVVKKMLSIEKEVTHTIIIQKSKFICKLIPIQNKEEIKNILEKVKEEYIDATHHCYAYICRNDKKCSDDGEPSSTAGMPMLNVLEKKELNYILCIVIRYFGGIKLGAGGLVRAYSNSVTETIKNADIINLTDGKEVTLTFSYSNEKQILYLLNNISIIKKEYNENIIYTICIDNISYQKLENTLKSVASIHIIKNILVKEISSTNY